MTLPRQETTGREGSPSREEGTRMATESPVRPQWPGREAGEALATGQELRRLVSAYAGHPLFRNTSGVHLPDNPYLRPLGADTLAEVDFARPLSESDFLSYGSLAANRILLNIYESESILLPRDGLGACRPDFEAFYGDQLRLLREAIRPDLERYAFGFLDDVVDVSGEWTHDALRAYFLRTVEEADGADNVALQAIESLRRPKPALDMLLIQLALDGLTEASAMARNLGGAYGPEQSELFKIFIDEFGYGVFDAKHSTIFERLLASRGMAAHVHAYWHFYMTGSIAVINYFNYLTDDHTKFFRYAGAVTYAEWTFAKFFADLGAVLHRLFGDAVDSQYCDEHAHIDQHHGRMTFENLLLGLARRHGADVIPDLVRGVEEIRWMTARIDEEFIGQITWADAIDEHLRRGADLYRRQAGAPTSEPPPGIRLRPDAPFGTRTYDRPMLLVVDEGEARLVTSGTGEPEPLRAGDCLLVPRSRLFGLAAQGGPCVYRLLAAGDGAA